MEIKEKHPISCLLLCVMETMRLTGRLWIINTFCQIWATFLSKELRAITTPFGIEVEVSFRFRLGF